MRIPPSAGTKDTIFKSGKYLCKDKTSLERLLKRGAFKLHFEAKIREMNPEEFVLRRAFVASLDRALKDYLNPCYTNEIEVWLNTPDFDSLCELASVPPTKVYNTFLYIKKEIDNNYSEYNTIEKD